VFDDNDYFAANLKGKVVDLVHKKNIGKGIDDYRNRRVYGDGLNGGIEFPKDVRIAEKQGKYAVFVLGVSAQWGLLV
jgi:hypothetical protein